MKIFLAAVPPWFPDQPYLSIPLLTGILRQEGHTVSQFDHNISFYNHLLEPDELRLSADAARSCIEELDPKQRLTLDIADSLIGQVEEAAAIFRDSRFYDARTLRSATETIELCLKIHSLLDSRLTVFLGDVVYQFNPLAVDEVARFVDADEPNLLHSFYARHHLKKLIAIQPDLYGISLTTSQQLVSGLVLCRLIREYSPATRVVLGGDIVRRLRHFLQNDQRLWKYFDYCVYGYGEEAIRALPKALSGEIAIQDVPNLLYPHGDSVACTSEQQHVRFTDLALPDFTDLPLDRYFSPEITLPIELSKGCYWSRCTFCEIVDLPYRAKSVDQFVTEMCELSEKYNANSFTLVDSAAPPARLLAIADRLSITDNDLRWRAMVKAERYYTPEVVARLYQGGCRMVMIGIESGNQRVLDLMDKGVTVAEAEKAIQNFAAARIWVHCYFIFAFPTETVEEAEETILFVRRNSAAIHSMAGHFFIMPTNSIVFCNQEKFHLGLRGGGDALSIHLTDFDGDLLSESQRAFIKNKFNVILGQEPRRVDMEHVHLNHVFLYASLNSAESILEGTA
jgi:anaerobic magnesium-protoporphyrin IX monomethyl ester cyclase